MKVKIITKIKKMINILYNTYGYYSYYHSKIDSHLVYLVSHSGADFTGNILRIAQELSTFKYVDYKLIIQAKITEKEKFITLLKKYNIKAQIVTLPALQLYYMEKAKYIFTDTVLKFGFVKREGQIVINTWHGTPFKHMGRKIKAELHTIGNTQRALFMSDYILFPNEYMKKIFIRDYMLENLWQGKCLLGGYPRNSVFFDSTRRRTVRKELCLEDKEIFAYMPTHRGDVYHKKNKEQKNSILDYLCELDNKLTDNQILLVKLHLYNNEIIDYRQYKHIKGWPQGYETYDILNVSNCLITDYSSVFFDYVNTHNKIILFPYDKKEYFSDRGIYFDFNKLPFPKVYNVDQLVRELNTSKQYDDSAFLETFCHYDSINATQKLCEQIFWGNKKLIIKQAPGNEKPNVIFYIGALTKNGITSAGLNILKTIDTSKYNYIVLFSKNIVKHPQAVEQIPNEINYYAIDGGIQFTCREKIDYKLLKNKMKKEFTFSDLSPVLHDLYKREYEKYFFHLPVSYFIDFCGYDKDITFIINESKKSRSIFVHNNMVAEAKEKSTVSLAFLNYVYKSYDKVIGVSVASTAVAAKIANEEGNDKFFTVHNCFDYCTCLEKSKQNITFDRNTICTTDNSLGISGVLASKGYKFITIGRFSREKAHKRLMDAFDCFWRTHREAQLIIIGGHGILYNQTLEYRKKLSCCANVTIIKSISNPINILSKCDLFILPSEHEGLPVVLFEADCVGVPILSTDIDGPREILENTSGGMLVEASEKGLYQGMQAFVEGKIRPLHINMYKYNKQCLNEFYHIFN